MSDPGNIKTLQKLLGDYSDLAHEAYLKFLEQFQEGFSLYFNVLMRNGDDFEFYFISFFENHSNKFRLLGSTASHRDFPSQVPIWKDDLLKFEVKDEKGENILFTKEFKFGDLDYALVEKCFNDDLTVLNPNIKYQGFLTLIKPGMTRILAIDLLRSPQQEAQRQKTKITSSLVSLIRQSVNESNLELQQNHLHRLQLRLKYWGMDIDISQFDNDPRIKRSLLNLPLIDFGLKDVYELKLIKDNLLLPVNNEVLIKSIEKMAQDQEKSLLRLLDSMTIKTVDQNDNSASTGK